MAFSDTYVLALGSNRGCAFGHRPAMVVRAGIAFLHADAAVRIMRVSPMIETAPIGPGNRRFCNGAMMIATDMQPLALLAYLKALERRFGRRTGQRWGDRCLDIDIILWSRGQWDSPTLQIPHRAFRERGFVLTPLNAIASGWRDPVTGLRIRHLEYRNRRPVQ